MYLPYAGADWWMNAGFCVGWSAKGIQQGVGV